VLLSISLPTVQKRFYMSLKIYLTYQKTLVILNEVQGLHLQGWV
jgi:hypothetical protein